MYVIALIGIGLVFHGFIMLTFSAFRSKIRWGLAVLFIPFALVFYPIYYWDQARKPFMTFTFGMALWLGTAIVFGQGPLDKYWLDKIDLVQSAEQFSQQFLPRQRESLEKRAMKLDNRRYYARPRSTVATPRNNVEINRISYRSLKPYLGEQAKITLNNTNIRNGRIVAATKDLITLQYTIGDRTIGSMTYDIALNEIRSVEIVR
jgi:hypothetical protein